MPKLFTSDRRRLFALVCIAVLIEGAAAALAAFATRQLFGDLHAGAGLTPFFFWSLPTAAIFIALPRIWVRAMGEKLGQSYVRDARIGFFEHHANMSLGRLQAIPRGYLSLRFVGDMAALGRWIGKGLPQLLGVVVLVPTALAVLLVIDPFTGAIILPIVLAATAAIVLSGARLQGIHADIRQKRAAIASRMSERLENAAHLRIAGRLRKESRSLYRNSGRLIAVAVRRAWRVETLRVLPELTAGIGATILFAAGAAHNTDPATIAGGIAALAIAVGPLRRLASIMDMLSAYKVARLKLQKALNRPVIAQTQQGSVKLDGPISVAAKAVKLGPVQGFDFSLAAGHWGTLQGANGSGKSLLLSAIAGLEDPEQGEIHLSGQPLRTVSRGTLRRHIALISPDCTILRGSLRRVLCLYLLERPSDSKLQRAVDKAGLSPLAERCGGLDGKIKEGARSLSNGERVRISIAQAILANPGLILVENVWPMLDSSGQKKLLAWLKRTGATVLCVGLPHHPPTVEPNAEELAVTRFKPGF